MKKLLLGLALFAVSAAANAVTVVLVVHNQTSGSGAVSSLLTDGSHVSTGTTSTVTWDWDGTTLSGSGLYSAASSIGSSPFSSSILADNIEDLSIASGVATATLYSCQEGTFLATVGASGCGGYNLGANFSDDSSTTWGPGTTISQTIGGDDVSTSSPRTISAYDFGFVSFTGTGLTLGDTVTLGNGVGVGSQGVGGGGEAMVFQVVPVPAAAWLFGSALGLLGWARRRVV